MTSSNAIAEAVVDADLVDMMDAVFATHRKAHPRTSAVTCDTELWSRLHGLGLVRLTGTGEGGSGAGWPEAAELIAAATRHAVRTPLAEHDLLACWLLEAVGVPADDAIRTICDIDESGTARHVPWASAAERIVVVWTDHDGHHVADLEADSVRVTKSTNMIGEPRDTVSVEMAILAPRAVSVDASLVAQLRRKAALVRALQVCAALDVIVELVVDHTSSRIQFGRSLSKFQAIQHLVADIAAEAALARTATEAALTAANAGDWAGENLDFLVAMARSCAGHAASVVVRNAHQAFGAIGTTIEHTLHEYTRAALAWRSEYGSVRHWDEVVAEHAIRAGAAGLWPLIAD